MVRKIEAAIEGLPGRVIGWALTGLVAVAIWGYGQAREADKQVVLNNIAAVSAKVDAIVARLDGMIDTQTAVDAGQDGRIGWLGRRIDSVEEDVQRMQNATPPF